MGNKFHPLHYLCPETEWTMSTEKNIRNIESDLEFENQIRPRELDNFAGQEKIVDNLRIFIQAV